MTCTTCFGPAAEAYGDGTPVCAECYAGEGGVSIMLEAMAMQTALEAAEYIVTVREGTGFTDLEVMAGDRAEVEVQVQNGAGCVRYCVTGYTWLDTSYVDTMEHELYFGASATDALDAALTAAERLKAGE